MKPLFGPDNENLPDLITQLFGDLNVKPLYKTKTDEANVQRNTKSEAKHGTTGSHQGPPSSCKGQSS